MAVLQIQTRRLSMRPFTMNDVDVLHRLWTDPQVRKYLWDDIVISREQAAEVVENSIASFTQRMFINNIEVVYYVISRETFRWDDSFYKISKSV